MDGVFDLVSVGSLALVGLLAHHTLVKPLQTVINANVRVDKVFGLVFVGSLALTVDMLDCRLAQIKGNLPPTLAMHPHVCEHSFVHWRRSHVGVV